MKRDFFSTCLKPVVGGLILFLVLVNLTSVSAASAGKIGKFIEVEARGKLLHYRKKTVLGRRQFDKKYNKFSTNKQEYFHALRKGLSTNHLEPYGLEAAEWEVSFTAEYRPGNKKEKYFSSLECKIEGGWSGSWFKFQWLLKPILKDKADLYGFNFIERGKGLLYEGEVKGVPITITLHFPRPIDHCHYHVWYRD